MKEITINPDNLSKDKVDDIKYKARAIILNKNGEMLITVNGGVYLLPGGSMIPGEDYITGVKREVLEETGIDMDESKINSLASYEEYVTNFPKRDGITLYLDILKQFIFFTIIRKIYTKIGLIYLIMKKRVNFIIYGLDQKK